MPDRDEEIDESTYPDGSPQNECWSEIGYTRRTVVTDDDEDLAVLRGD